MDYGSLRITGIPIAAVATTLVVAACQTVPDPDPRLSLVERGEQLFLEETFGGNGRTCGTCHQPLDNFGLTPAFIATLPDDDPLFVAEREPDLSQNFENPVLMRGLGLIVENQDGFGDLANDFNMRGIPHTLGMRHTIASAAGPRTGWSGDGSPGDGSLRSFATGAVIQHFTKTTARIPGVDFRLPTDEELDAMEAFQLSLGRQEELQLPLPLKGVVAQRGQAIFLDNTLGMCNACHANAGANADPAIFGVPNNNLNFNTGVEDLPDQPQDLTGELVPPDDGFGTPGNGEFNTPSLIEAADTPPFFHNNAVTTLEGAVAFYNGDAFNNSPAGQLLANATGGPINLDATQVEAIAAFLRVINALENIRAASELLTAIRDNRRLVGRLAAEQPRVAAAEIEDARRVLQEGLLHPAAVMELDRALRLANKLVESSRARAGRAGEALAALQRARAALVDS